MPYSSEPTVSVKCVCVAATLSSTTPFVSEVARSLPFIHDIYLLLACWCFYVTLCNPVQFILLFIFFLYQSNTSPAAPPLSSYILSLPLLEQRGTLANRKIVLHVKCFHDAHPRPPPCRGAQEGAAAVNPN